MKKGLIFGIIVTMCVPTFSATSHKEEWDSSDMAGWTGNTRWTIVEVKDTGGNPGGYLLTKNGEIPYYAGANTRKAEFTGSYGTASEARISVDLNVMDDIGLRVIYLRFRYKDSRYNGWKYVITNAPETNQWITHTVSFSPTWSDSEAESAGWIQEMHSPSFSETMAEVYTAEIRLEGSGTGISMIAGIDNFKLVLGDPDEDNDGVYDDIDMCPDTPDGDIVDELGCSINQYCPCDSDWKNHGQFVSCIAHMAEAFLNEGLIVEEEKDAIVSDAARSDCGKKKPSKKR